MVDMAKGGKTVPRRVAGGRRMQVIAFRFRGECPREPAIRAEAALQVANRGNLRYRLT
jgi:hypothetical protein